MLLDAVTPDRPIGRVGDEFNSCHQAANSRSRRDAFIVRHIALCLAALTTFLFRESLGVGVGALWLIGVAAALNSLLEIAAGQSRWRPLVNGLSPGVSIAAWAVLVNLTGGVGSPFVAGFGVEILLSTAEKSRRNLALVTLGSMIALWTQQATRGISGNAVTLVLHVGVMAMLSMATLSLGAMWKRERAALDGDYLRVRRDFEQLERAFGDARYRALAEEDAARLAHSLGNSAHALSGFARLLDDHVGDDDTRREEIRAGLNLAIARVEALTHDALSRKGGSISGRVTSTAELARIVDRLHHEIRARFPSIRTMTSPLSGALIVDIPSDVIYEVLQELFLNAAIAVGDNGTVCVKAAAEGALFRLDIEDDGPGLPEGKLDRLFDAGFTTRSAGHGLGLFHARRTIEKYAGRLVAGEAESGGARFSLLLPLAQA